MIPLIPSVGYINPQHVIWISKLVTLDSGATQFEFRTTDGITYTIESIGRSNDPKKDAETVALAHETLLTCLKAAT